MRTYTTVSGDMWDSISYALYGSEFHISELMEVNRRHINVSVFGGNVKLTAPDIAPRSRLTLPPWRR